MTSQELAGGAISNSDKVIVEGRLGVRLVAHVLQRPLMGTFSSLQEVGLTFFNELKSTAGDKLKSSCPARWSSAGMPAPQEVEQVSVARASCRARIRPGLRGGRVEWDTRTA